ncbi:MAG: SURF1 family protein [Rhizobiales bacterium]|nr:SURF1 family protein [Hyphomicrobiales bacterium]NRB13526.1 SURF1 family protein [Hyphomicrobiales bacterium]
MTFKPYPWLTFFATLVFAALITMGVWQVQRYEWKTILNANIAAAAKLEPASLGALTALGTTEDFKYRPVKITGNYVADKQVLVRGQYKKSARTILYGYYVFTPFEYLSEGAAKYIMIDRGFITENAFALPETYNQLPTAELVIYGHVKIAETQGGFLPDNVMADEVWYWRDIASMATKFGFQNADNFYVSLSQNDLQDFPKVTKIEIKSANNHLSYLITWFALAAGLLILYIYLHIYAGRLYLNHKPPAKTD